MILEKRLAIIPRGWLHCFHRCFDWLHIFRWSQGAGPPGNSIRELVGADLEYRQALAQLKSLMGEK